MSGAIAAGAVVAIGTAAYSANQQKKAAAAGAKAQMGAAAASNDVQMQIHNQQREDAQPWQQAGKDALAQLSPQMPELTRNFGADDFQKDSGYQFRMDEGLKAIDRSAAARGGLNSGATLKALNRFGQGFASNEYQNAYNRFTSNQNNTFNKYAAIAGVGQQANSQLGQAGQNYAGAVGNNMMGAANAQAAAGVASANANSQMASTIANTGMNTWMNYQQRNK